MEGENTAGLTSVAVKPQPKPVLNLAIAGTRVFIALPWQKHTNPMTAFCVGGLLERGRTFRCLNFGDAFVAHSRNTCADLFLQTDCEWMMMIDDDMLVPFGNAKWFNAYTGANWPEKFAGVNSLDRLLSHKKSLIGGLYFGRHDHGVPMYAEGASNGVEADFARKAPVDLIKPTRWVATGCLLIHRKVFEDIETKYPQLARVNGMRGHWFSSSEHTAMDAIEKARVILSKGLSAENALQAQTVLESAAKQARSRSALGVGEDVQFCQRAAEAGHQPYVDFGTVCGHIGHRIYGPWNTKNR